MCLVQEPEALHATPKMTEQLCVRAGLLTRAVCTLQTLTLGCRVLLRWGWGRRGKARAGAHQPLVNGSLAASEGWESD